MTGKRQAYDANGNITHITHTDSTGTTTVVNNIYYYYDDIGQLIREDNQALKKTYVYTYDDAGNRTSKKTYAYTTSTTLGTVQSTETYSYPDNPEYEYWGDQLTSINGYEITYDNIGNPVYYYVNDSEVEFTWEGRQLVRVDEYTNGNFEYLYEYNDEGIRTSKTVSGTEYKYTLNGSQIVSQEWDNKLIIFFYDDLGAPIGYAYRTTSMTANTFYYYIYEKNLQGDIVAIYNTSGVRLVSYTYDAWGNVSVSNLNISGTNAGAQYNPFRYRGYYYDEETKLYYLNSRYYDPATGRFVSADGYLNANGDIVGFNMYAYCSNNPINYVDPTGCIAIVDDIAVGVAFVAFLCIATLVLTFPYEEAYVAVANAVDDTADAIQDAYETAAEGISYLVDSLDIKKKYDSNERHHIVARRDFRAILPRIVLESSGIDINDNQNIAVVNKSYHRVLHTNAYYMLLNVTIVGAYCVDGEEGVEKMLSIYKNILEGSTLVH